MEHNCIICGGRLDRQHDDEGNPISNWACLDCGAEYNWNEGFMLFSKWAKDEIRRLRDYVGNNDRHKRILRGIANILRSHAAFVFARCEDGETVAADMRLAADEIEWLQTEIDQLKKAIKLQVGIQSDIPWYQVSDADVAGWVAAAQATGSGNGT